MNLEALQKKVKNLEEENIYLQDETSDLRKCAVELENREEQLVTDCVQQLGRFITDTLTCAWTHAQTHTHRDTHMDTL